MHHEKEVRRLTFRKTEIHGAGEYIIMSIAFLFFFEFTRELLGTIYNLNLATMSLNSSLVAILAFFSPLLYFFKLDAVRSTKLAGICGIIFVACRVLLSLDPSLYLYLAGGFIGIASFGIFLCAFLSLPGKNPPQQPRVPMNTIFIYAAITGAGGDLFFRTLGTTFDVTIHGITAHPWSSLFFVIPLAAAFCVALVMWYRNHSSDELHSHSSPPACRKRTLVMQGISIGAVGFLFLTILAYPNTLSRWIDGSYTLSVILYACACGGFFWVSILLQGKKFIYSGHGALAGILILFLTIILLTYTSLSLIVSILSALSLLLIPMIVLFHMQALKLPHLTMKNRAAFFTIAAVTLVILMVLSVFTLTHSYVPGMGILRDQMGTLLIIAALMAIFTTVPLITSSVQSMIPSGSVLSKHLLVFMGILIIIGPSLGAGFFSEPHPLPPARESLRLMTYNIHQGYNTEGKINPWEILETITRVDPHIIALQESDMNRITSTNVDIVRWLAHKLDMYSYFGPGTNHQIYGVSLLSTFPLTNTDVYFLSSIEDQRVLVRGDIEYKGSPLSIYVVHMGLSEEDRTKQTAQILNILSDNSQDSILLGDFNSTPDSLQMNQFFIYYRDAWAASGHPVDDPSSYTFSSLFPEKHIDYILIPQEWEHRVIRCVILSDIYASDHFPVWAEIV